MLQQNVMISFDESRPVYYLGWIIQPTINGYYVYDRRDRDIIGLNNSVRIFDTIEEAFKYVDIFTRTV
jgi:hypothetical protein